MSPDTGLLRPSLGVHVEQPTRNTSTLDKGNSNISMKSSTESRVKTLCSCTPGSTGAEGEPRKACGEDATCRSCDLRSLNALLELTRLLGQVTARAHQAAGEGDS